MRLGMHGSSVCHRKRSRILCSCGTRSTHVPLRDVCFRDVIESSLGSVCRRWPTAGVFTMMSSKRSSDPRPALARMAAVRGAPVAKLPPLRQDSGPQSTPPHPGRPGEWNSSSAVYRAASTASRTAVPALGRGWTSRRVRLTEPVERSFIATPARRSSRSTRPQAAVRRIIRIAERYAADDWLQASAHLDNHPFGWPRMTGAIGTTAQSS